MTEGLSHKNEYFHKPYELFGGDINIKVDLSNYARKADLKDATRLDTSKPAAKSNLANLKAEIDKLDIDKLVPFPADFTKLSDAVKNDVVEKTVYYKLVLKVNRIDTSGFLLKTKYDTDKSDLENKIPDTSGLLKKLDYNAKITEIQNKIPGISGLATSSALNALESEIPNISSFVKKKQIITQKLLKLKKKLLIMIMINILLLRNLIILQQGFLLQG